MKPEPKASAWPWIIGEVVGAFLLVFFGCGSVCATVLHGARVRIFQVSIVWGIGNLLQPRRVGFRTFHGKPMGLADGLCLRTSHWRGRWWSFVENLPDQTLSDDPRRIDLKIIS
jgi:hypothetical protein